MRALDVLRSSAFRVALAFALAMTAATSLIFGIVYLQIITSNEASIRVILADEAAKGVNDTDAEIRSALNLRLTRDLRRLDYVALFDAAGKIVIGNIDAMPEIAADGKAHFVAAVRPPGVPDRLEPAIFVARRRADGGTLVLGRSLVEVYALRETVLVALATGLLPLAGGLRDRRVLCAPHVAQALADPRNHRHDHARRPSRAPARAQAAGRNG